MTETIQFKKLAQKRKTNTTETFLYPKNQSKLYTKEEFELLDSIYSSDETHSNENISNNEEELQRDNFWIRNREELLALQKTKSNLFNNISWFTAGVMLTSVAFLIYSQATGLDVKQKQDTQIIFQKTAQVMTDKTADKNITNQLDSNEFAKNQVSQTNPVNKEKKFDLFEKKVVEPSPKIEAKPAVQNVQVNNTYHVIRGGDSLWIIANKYYSNPSQENINKIMKANNMKSVYSTLQLGQKLVIPQ